MNRRTDSCPSGCVTQGGQLAVALPSAWEDTATGAVGEYRCPVCGRTWQTHYRHELDAVRWP